MGINRQYLVILQKNIEHIDNNNYSRSLTRNESCPITSKLREICSCDNHKNRGIRCKHINVVRYIIQRNKLDYR